MQTKSSFESLLSPYYTDFKSHESPATSGSPDSIAGPSFNTNIGNGNVVNVVGDHYTILEGPSYSPTRINHAPTGAITRHFVGRFAELQRIQHVFDSPREADRPVRGALCGAAGIGKTQLALHYAQCAYAQERYSQVFNISASSADQVREGLALVLRLTQPSDYVCAESVEVYEARRRLEEAQSHIRWLLIVDSAVLDSVNYLRTHLPQKNMCGDILFVTQSEAVASALVDDSNRVVEVGPLTCDDAVQLLFKKAGLKSTTELLKEARLVVERLDHLPIPICQAASFNKYSHGNFQSLTRLLKEVRRPMLLRWETRLTGYEHNSFESLVQAQLSRITSNRPEAAELLKVLCFLHPSGVSLPILFDGARLMRPSSPKKSKLAWFLPRSPLNHTLPPPLLFDAIASQGELQNLIRCLQYSSLVHLEAIHSTSATSYAVAPEVQSSHVLRIPNLIRRITRRGTGQTEEKCTYHNMAVLIVVTAFLQYKHDPSLWSPFVKHLSYLIHWKRRLGNGTSPLLFEATHIISHTTHTLKQDMTLEFLEYSAQLDKWHNILFTM